MKRHDVARQQRVALFRRQVVIGDGRRRVGLHASPEIVIAQNLSANLVNSVY